MLRPDAHAAKAGCLEKASVGPGLGKTRALRQQQQLSDFELFQLQAAITDSRLKDAYAEVGLEVMHQILSSRYGLLSHQAGTSSGTSKHMRRQRSQQDSPAARASSAARRRATGNDEAQRPIQHQLASDTKSLVDNIIHHLNLQEEATGSSSPVADGDQPTSLAGADSLSYEQPLSRNEPSNDASGPCSPGAAPTQGSDAHASMGLPGAEPSFQPHARAGDPKPNSDVVPSATVPASSSRPSAGSEATAADGAGPDTPSSSGPACSSPADASRPRRFQSHMPLMPSRSKPAAKPQANGPSGSKLASEGSPAAPDAVRSRYAGAGTAASCTASATADSRDANDAQVGVAPRLLAQFGTTQSTTAAPPVLLAEVDEATDSDDEPCSRQDPVQSKADAAASQDPDRHPANNVQNCLDHVSEPDAPHEKPSAAASGSRVSLGKLGRLLNLRQ